jgi:hypothetical protein
MVMRAHAYVTVATMPERAGPEIRSARFDGRYNSVVWVFRCIEVPQAVIEPVDAKTVRLVRFKQTTYVRIGDGICWDDEGILLYGLVTRIGLHFHSESGKRLTEPEENPYVIEVQQCYLAKDIRGALGEASFDELLGTYPNGRLVVEDEDMFIGVAGQKFNVFPDIVLGKVTILDKDDYAQFHTKPGYQPSVDVFKAVARYDDVEEKLSRLIMKTRSLDTG